MSDPSEAAPVAETPIDLVNRVWRERENIIPIFRERKQPTIYAIYNLLSKTNCKECEYPTCLAFAADVRN